MSHHINLTRIKGVANALADIKNEIVFVGGATVSLYADDPDQIEVRPTDDIDVLIEIATYSAYAKLQEKLSQLGFTIDTEANVTCRFKYQGLTVDIMPTDENVLGFSNRWYADGLKNATTYSVDNGTDISIFSVDYFIAAKLEAHAGRGNDDGRTSKDFEDIVFVLDNRVSIWDDLKAAPGDVVDYLKNEFSELLSNRHIDEWISCHLEPSSAGKRGTVILEGMRAIVG